jgi:hypothetical protein
LTKNQQVEDIFIGIDRNKDKPTEEMLQQRRKLIGPQRTFSSSSEYKEEDLEQGFHVETLQDQSSRLMSMMAAKTELADFDQLKPDPPKEIRVEKETSGLTYWAQEIATAKEHGGDYKERTETAIWAALGSMLTFACIVFPDQNVLGAVCIGNIWMHCNIKSSFGESLTSVLGFARSIILTTIVTWPIAYFFNHLDTLAASILLPFMVFILTFLIMSCPHLTSNNLMLVGLTFKAFLMVIHSSRSALQETQWIWKQVY